MAPAWGGVLGGALTTAANAYLDTVLNEPYEKIRKRKAELELDRLESQIAYDKARAAYEQRRTDRALRQQIIKDKAGNVWRYNPDTEGVDLLIESQGTALKLKDVREAAIQRAMETIIGGPTGPKPMDQWTPDEVKDRRLMPYWDLLGQGRSQLQQIPGNQGDVVPTADIPGYGTPPGQRATPPARPTQPPSASPVPPTQTLEPTGPPPVVSPPRVPGSSGRGPSGSQGGRTTRRPGTPPLAEEGIKGWMKDYEALSDSDLQTELDTLTKLQAESPSVIILSKLEAISRVQAARRSGTSPSPTSAGPVQPPAKTQPEPYGPAVPPSSGPQITLPPTTPPPASVDWGRERNIPLTNEQLDEIARKKWDAQLKYEDAERQRLAAERQAREEENRRELELVGGQPTKEQAAVTNKLFAQKKVGKRFYPQLEPAEQQLVNETINLPKLRKEEQSWKKLAQPHMDELDALQTAQDLTTSILPLIQDGTVGFRGQVAGVGLSIRSLFMRNRFYSEAEAKMRATPEGRELLAKLGPAAVQAQIAADVETNDPAVRAAMRPIATRARLQTLASVLMYAHALAQKRITGGSQRGLIKSDMDEAHKLFDPDMFFANPEQLIANLQELQGVIQASRKKVAEKVASFHFDPVTKRYLPAEVEGLPTPDEQLLLEGAR